MVVRSQKKLVLETGTDSVYASKEDEQSKYSSQSKCVSRGLSPRRECCITLLGPTFHDALEVQLGIYVPGL